MRTCRTCGKSIEHKRAGALHCDDDCRARYGQGIRAKAPAPDPTAVFGGDHPQTDPVFGDLAAALAGPPAPTRLDTDSVSTSRPPREPPAITRPPGEHLREPDIDAASLDKRLYELELRMSAYDLEQPWQDWYDDAKKLVDEARKLVERAKQGDAGLRERVERIEKQLAAPANPPNVGAFIDDKLRHVWREIEKVDKATASRQSVEKLGEQVRSLLGVTGGDGRLDSLTERTGRVEASVAQLLRGHAALRARGDKLAESLVSFARQVSQRLGIRVDDEE